MAGWSVVGVAVYGAVAVSVVEVVGVQTPRYRSVPGYVSSLGGVVAEVAAACGYELDEWQRSTLEDACGVRGDGKWASFEVGLNVARQNGKGSVLEARELAGIVHFGERLIVHSAHEFATSTIAMGRMEEALEESGLMSELRPRGGISRSHGSEGFIFKSGQRIWYRTRTKGGGRGFSGDLIVFDEAMILQEIFIGALLPIVSAKSITGNPQVWYTGSAVDQLVHDHGIVFARVRERGLRGDDPSLAYFEFSGADAFDEHDQPITPDRLDDADLRDRGRWASANPSLGIRIAGEHVEKELRSMDNRTFAVERLGVGDWPATDGSGAAVIDIVKWDALLDERSRIDEQLCFAFDVSPDRNWGAIAAAGLRGDGLSHFEVVEHRRGTGWMVDRIVEVAGAHENVGVVCDGASPAASLVHELADRGVEVATLSADEHAQACGMLFDLVEQERGRHLGTPELRSAVRGAAKRPLGDRWAWARRSSAVDISPLVAVTIAGWGSATLKPEKKPDMAWAFS